MIYPKDFFNEHESIEITLTYKLEPQEEKEVKNTLTEKGFEKDIVSKIKIDDIIVCATFEPDTNATKKVFDKISFQKRVFEDYTLQGDKPVKKDTEQEQEDFDIEKYFEAHLPKYFWKISHRIVFWKSDSKHLINDQINLGDGYKTYFTNLLR